MEGGEKDVDIAPPDSYHYNNYDATCRRLRVSLMNVRVMRPLGEELNNVKQHFGVLRQTHRLHPDQILVRQ